MRAPDGWWAPRFELDSSEEFGSVSQPCSPQPPVTPAVGRFKPNRIRESNRRSLGWFTVSKAKTYKERLTMTNSITKTKRPSSITLLSVFEIMGGIDLIYFVLSPGIQNYIQNHGVGETMFFAFSGIVLLVSGVGFWLMKKWAVYTVAALAIIAQVYLISVGRWNIFSLLIPMIPIYLGYKHFSKMT